MSSSIQPPSSSNSTAGTGSSSGDDDTIDAGGDATTPSAVCGDNPTVFLPPPNSAAPCQGLSTTTPNAAGIGPGGYPTYPGYGTGFTAGAGVYIVINQLPGFLGIEKSAIVKDLWGINFRCAFFDLLRLLRSIEGVNLTSALLAMLTLAIVRVLLLRRVKRRQHGLRIESGKN